MTPPRRLLREKDAAIYCGVSATKFEQMIKIGKVRPGFEIVKDVFVWDAWDLYFVAQEIGQYRDFAEVVYFVAGGDFIKIGYTSCIEKRFSSLDASVPFDIALEATVPGDRELETSLHRAFAHERVKGEWFRRSDRLASLVAHIRGHGELPDISTWN